MLHRGACRPLTMRTLPSASVISSSDTFESDTKSIRVFSFRKSMRSPTIFMTTGSKFSLNARQIGFNFAAIRQFDCPTKSASASTHSRHAMTKRSDRLRVDTTPFYGGPVSPSRALKHHGERQTPAQIAQAFAQRQSRHTSHGQREMPPDFAPESG